MSFVHTAVEARNLKMAKDWEVSALKSQPVHAEDVLADIRKNLIVKQQG
ncbi:hypothetical protein [Stenotrophomonas sp.]|nr:hypothetical protein [Stenotrophomonas sp.]MBD3825629.1 hypothetical protein [Stenotrophomonas sp.]